MQFGFFNDAESLGYDSVWATDSQMIFSDCYAVPALAARQTRRIRLGPGTASSRRSRSTSRASARARWS